MSGTRGLVLAILVGFGLQSLVNASCAKPDYQRYANLAVCTNEGWAGSTDSPCEAQCNANPRCSFFAVWSSGHCELFDQCLGVRDSESTVFWKTESKMVVRIGASNYSTKCVPVPFGVGEEISCAVDAGLRGKRVNQDSADAELPFSIQTRDSKVCASRTDQEAWAMDLQVACCRPQAKAPFHLSALSFEGENYNMYQPYLLVGYTVAGAPFYRGQVVGTYYMFWDETYGASWYIANPWQSVLNPFYTAWECSWVGYLDSTKTSMPPLGQQQWQVSQNNGDVIPTTVSLTARAACPVACRHAVEGGGTCTGCVSWSTGACVDAGTECGGTDCSLCQSDAEAITAAPSSSASSTTVSPATGGTRRGSHGILFVCLTVLASSAVVAAGLAARCCTRSKARADPCDLEASSSDHSPSGSGAVPTPPSVAAGAAAAQAPEPQQAAEEWERLKAKWGFLARYESFYSPEQKEALQEYLQEPGKWSISWNGLMRLEDMAKAHFKDDYASMSMLDVVEELVKPTCATYGAPMALVLNNWTPSPVEGFVTHCWSGNFAEFIRSLNEAYRTRLSKPNLFVCAFTIFQGSPQDISQALGAQIEEAPFVRCLALASHLTVVRCQAVDIYERGWCLIEFLYAKKFGLYPQRVNVTGPNTFQDSDISVMDAKASVRADREKILKAILAEGSAEEMDRQIGAIRAYFG